MHIVTSGLTHKLTEHATGTTHQQYADFPKQTLMQNYELSPTKPVIAKEAFRMRNVKRLPVAFNSPVDSRDLYELFEAYVIS